MLLWTIMCNKIRVLTFSADVGTDKECLHVSKVIHRDHLKPMRIVAQSWTNIVLCQATKPLIWSVDHVAASVLPRNGRMINPLQLSYMKHSSFSAFRRTRRLQRHLAVLIRLHRPQ